MATTPKAPAKKTAAPKAAPKAAPAKAAAKSPVATKPAAPAGIATGRISQIIGAVVDVEFTGHLPAIMNALETTNTDQRTGQPFRLGQVDPAIFKGATGKLSGVGHPAVRNRLQRSQNRRDNRTPTVKVNFCQILTSGRRRPRKPERQAVI